MTQVAVRMNDELLGDLDWLVVRCDFENRAEAIRAAVTELIKRERDRAIAERIVRAYTGMPQSDDEAIPSDLSVREGLDDEDWSDRP